MSIINDDDVFNKDDDDDDDFRPVTLNKLFSRIAQEPVSEGCDDIIKLFNGLCFMDTYIVTIFFNIPEYSNAYQVLK